MKERARARRERSRRRKRRQRRRRRRKRLLTDDDDDVNCSCRNKKSEPESIEEPPPSNRTCPYRQEAEERGGSGTTSRRMTPRTPARAGAAPGWQHQHLHCPICLTKPQLIKTAHAPGGVLLPVRVRVTRMPRKQRAAFTHHSPL